jgi:hypothetical protein
MTVGFNMNDAVTRNLMHWGGGMRRVRLVHVFNLLAEGVHLPSVGENEIAGDQGEFPFN